MCRLMEAAGAALVEESVAVFMDFAWPMDSPSAPVFLLAQEGPFIMVWQRQFPFRHSSAQAGLGIMHQPASSGLHRKDSPSDAGCFWPSHTDKMCRQDLGSLPIQLRFRWDPER